MALSVTHEIERDEWKKRADALGRVQSRYLWIALVVGLFFFALQHSAPDSVKTDVPVVGLKLDPRLVLAFGGSTIAFLVVAVVGSMRAWGDAMKTATGDNWREHAERLDMYPTVFDLAYYTTRRRVRFLEIALYFLFYPTFLALLLAESASLQWWLWLRDVPGRSVFLPLGTVIWLWAAWLVGELWVGRARHVLSQRLSRNT